MKTFCAARFALLLAVFGMGASFAGAGEEVADKKTVKRILAEIQLMPSLYGKNEPPVKFKSLPKFSAKKLADYARAKKQTVAQERARYKADKEKYASEFPLRAVVLDAADAAAELQHLDLSLTLSAPLSLSQKGDFLQKQQPIGRALFMQEKVLAKMREAAGERDKETSKRWLANYDFALTRVQADILFLFEYSFALGMIRADALPELGPGDDGWKISFQPKLGVTEFKVKVLAKERNKLLRRIQDDHAGTPWAYFAEQESRREVGMQWAPKKK